MIHRLTDNIWFGDKPSVEEARGEVKSVINVAHSIRRPYWKNLGGLPWDVWYFRLASPDREPLSVEYIRGLSLVLDAIEHAGKFPLLCHCRAGGHRGPAAAVFALWHLGNRTLASFNYAKAKAERLRPGCMRERRSAVYQRDLFAYCWEHSK